MPQASPNNDSLATGAGSEIPAITCLALVQQVAISGRQIKRMLASLLAESDLSEAQLLLLWACADSGSRGIAQNRLASLVGLSTAQVSGLVERLSRGELIAERANADDRRRRLWCLTNAGHDRLEQVLQRLEPLAAELEARIGRAHVVELTRLLDRAGRVTEEISGNVRGAAPLRLFRDGTSPSDASECRGQEDA